MPTPTDPNPTCWIEIRLGGQFMTVGPPAEEIRRCEWRANDPGPELFADFVERVIGEQYRGMRVIPNGEAQTPQPPKPTASLGWIKFNRNLPLGEPVLCWCRRRGYYVTPWTNDDIEAAPEYWSYIHAPAPVEAIGVGSR